LRDLLLDQVHPGRVAVQFLVLAVLLPEPTGDDVGRAAAERSQPLLTWTHPDLEVVVRPVHLQLALPLCADLLQNFLPEFYPISHSRSTSRVFPCAAAYG